MLSILSLKERQSAIIMGYQTLVVGKHGGLFSSTAVQQQILAPLSDAEIYLSLQPLWNNITRAFRTPTACLI